MTQLRQSTLSFVVSTTFLTTLTISFSAPVRHGQKPVATGTGGAVATISEPASQAAITILNKGGNAIDAAVAARPRWA
jgi:gamma-glutamyltranspeptidase/glutathione hydrolase